MISHQSHPITPEIVATMLLRVAGLYIRLGSSISQRENHLRVAISAWNIACLPKHKHAYAIEKLVKQFKKHNPNITSQNIINFEHDIRQLAAEKQDVYPDFNIQILNGYIDTIEDKEHICVSIQPQNA